MATTPFWLRLSREDYSHEQYYTIHERKGKYHSYTGRIAQDVEDLSYRHDASRGSGRRGHPTARTKNACTARMSMPCAGSAALPQPHCRTFVGSLGRGAGPDEFASCVVRIESHRERPSSRSNRDRSRVGSP